MNYSRGCGRLKFEILSRVSRMGGFVSGAVVAKVAVDEREGGLWLKGKCVGLHSER